MVEELKEYQSKIEVTKNRETIKELRRPRGNSWFRLIYWINGNIKIIRRRKDTITSNSN